MLQRRNVVVLGLVIAAFAVLLYGRTARTARTPRTKLDMLLNELRYGEREQVAAVVEKMSKLSQAELRDLARAVRDDNPNIQRGAALALAAAPSLDIDTIKLLEPGLRDPAPTVKASCTRAIGKSDWKSPEAAALLATLLTDPSPDVRGAAATALGEQGTFARPYIATLNKLMFDDPFGSGAAVASACGKLGKTAIGTETGLRNLINIGLDGTDEAIDALGQLQTHKALEILIETAKGKLPSINLSFPTKASRARRAIAEFGAAGKAVLESL